MRYTRYHAIGNDYIIINPTEVHKDLSGDSIRLICHRNFRVGSDAQGLGTVYLSQRNNRKPNIVFHE
jgi:diaminopimelate epimerase